MCKLTWPWWLLYSETLSIWIWLYKIYTQNTNKTKKLKITRLGFLNADFFVKRDGSYKELVPKVLVDYIVNVTCRPVEVRWRVFNPIKSSS